MGNVHVQPTIRSTIAKSFISLLRCRLSLTLGSSNTVNLKVDNVARLGGGAVLKDKVAQKTKETMGRIKSGRKR